MLSRKKAPLLNDTIYKIFILSLFATLLFSSRLYAAANVIPSKATLISPSGTITDTTPTYTWNAVSGSTWYYLWVNEGSSKKIVKWYTAASAGCGSGSGTCSVTPATSLGNGAHTWWIRTYNSSGNGPWSSPKSFSVSAGTLPGKAIPLSPKNTINDRTPTYTWNAVSNSTWYYLWVNDNSGKKFAKWYTAASVGCGSGSGTCSVTPAIALGGGTYHWWIRTYNSSGYGPWSYAQIFKLTDNSEFHGDLSGWSAVANSPWGVNADFAYSQGVAGKLSSMYYSPSQFSNFRYTAKIQRKGNDNEASRLIIRGNPNNLDSKNNWDGYVFQITRAGKYSILKYNGGSITPLQHWVSSSMIHKGNAWNELTVFARGSNLWFGINGVWVKHVTDSTFTSGKVGIGLYSSDGSGKLFVDWVRIRKYLRSSRSSASSKVAKKISDEQLQLNNIANLNPSSGMNSPDFN